MLDTNICSFIIREKPAEVINTLQRHVQSKSRIVISAITYSELMFGSINKKASPKMPLVVAQFVERMDAVVPWDKEAVEATTWIKQELNSIGKPIGGNDAAIAGNAIALGCILVTNNTREFERVDGLVLEDWVR